MAQKNTARNPLNDRARGLEYHHFTISMVIVAVAMAQSIAFIINSANLQV